MMNSLNRLFFLGLILTTFGTLAQSGGQAEVYEKHVCILASDSLQGRGLGTEGAIKAQSYIYEQFTAAGLKPFGDSFFQPFKFRQSLTWTPAKNIVGYLEGSDPELKNEFIVVGAHYDHQGYAISRGDTIIYPGADDNASGTAMVIELAKHFSALENKPKRSIIFICFDAEESGLHGAYHFVANPPVPIEQVKLMFSLDMVGMLNIYKGLDLKGIGLLSGGLSVFQEAAKDLGIKLKDTSAKVEQQTDTAPFGNVGIPAVHVFTGLVSPYHKPTDKCDLLEYDGMEKIEKLMIQALTEFGNMPTLRPDDNISVDKIIAGGKKPFFYFGLTLQNGWGTFDFSDEFFRGRSTYTGALGTAMQFRLSKNFRLVNHLLLDFNGSNVPDGVARRLSFTAPVMLQIASSDASNDYFRVYGNLGAFYRYNFFNTVGGSSIDFDNDFRNEEWGMSVGLGVQIMKFDVYYNYRRSLSPNRINGLNFQDINQVIGVTYRLF